MSWTGYLHLPLSDRLFVPLCLALCQRRLAVALSCRFQLVFSQGEMPARGREGIEIEGPVNCYRKNLAWCWAHGTHWVMEAAPTDSASEEGPGRLRGAFLFISLSLSLISVYSLHNINVSIQTWLFFNNVYREDNLCALTSALQQVQWIIHLVWGSFFFKVIITFLRENFIFFHAISPVRL